MFIHEYNSALKRDAMGILCLEDIMLSKISQLQDKHCLTNYGLSPIVKLLEAESTMVVSLGEAGGETGNCCPMGV